jgi:hypothetical protein
MSLVNDALKRAKQTQQENPPPVPPLEFRPVEPANEGQSGSPLLVVGAVLGLIVVVTVGGLLIWAVGRQPEASLHAAARSVVEPVPAAVPSTPEALPEPVNTNSHPEVVEPPKPELKLQAILFNPRNPSALVNGRTVYVGDRVSGARVTAITPKAVTLTSETFTNVLSLSE